MEYNFDYYTQMAFHKGINIYCTVVSMQKNVESLS